MSPGDAHESANHSPGAKQRPDLTLPAEVLRSRRRAVVAGLIALLLLAAALAAGAWYVRQRQAGQATSPIARAPSIAVLPFTSDGSDRRDLYFAEGLSVEMHDALAGVPGLKVAARSGLAAANRINPDLRQLGDLLGVSAVLQAHVRRDGRRVHVVARLAETATGLTLWSDKYDREMSSVFAVQTEIASQVTRHMLGTGASRPEALRRRLQPTANVSAFDDYLKGVYALQAQDGENTLDDSVQSFAKALSIDPQFARAQAGICRAQIKRLEVTRNADAYQAAQQACARAKEMDPSLNEVNLALGELARVQGKDDEAIAYYNTAMQDAALRADAYLGLARTESNKKNPQLVLAYYQRALSLRPGDARVYGLLGYHYYLIGNLENAVENYQIAATLQPDADHLWNSLGGLYLIKGERAKAEQAFGRCLAIKPNYGALSNLGLLKYEDGRYAEAVALFRRATALMPEDYRTWGNLADALQAEGDSGTEAHEAYQRAARFAQSYVEATPKDAQARAQLAWFQANLGLKQDAAAMIKSAQRLQTESADVALWASLVALRLGEKAEAQRYAALARQKGVPESRIQSHPLLKSLGRETGNENTGR